MAGTPIVHPDFHDLLESFVENEVRFLVVGAFALAALGRPRATGDLDLWIDATTQNAERVLEALRHFGAPLQDLTEDDLSKPGVFFTIGVEPIRIDILTEVPGLEFTAAWERRLATRLGDIPVHCLSAPDFVISKHAAGRPQDLVDAEVIERLIARKLV